VAVGRTRIPSVIVRSDNWVRSIGWYGCSVSS